MREEGGKSKRYIGGVEGKKMMRRERRKVENSSSQLYLHKSQ